MTMERRSAPIMTLSLASSNSRMVTMRLLRRAASKAASLTRLARSAPEKPGVPRAIVCAFTSGAIGTFFMWTLRIFSRPTMSGFGTDDLTVETAGTQQRRVENVGAVGRRDEDHAFVGLEAVHLDEQLVQRLLALVVAAAEARAAMAADGVDFVDEDDAGRVLLGLLEHVAHAAGADADEHFDEVGTRDGEERHVRFAGDGAREQRLAGARRADQQRALRNLAAEALELLRVAQEFDDLLQLFLGFIDAGDVVEGDAAMAFGEQLGAALAEAHRLAAARLHLAHEEDPDADEQQHREPVHEDRQKRRRVRCRRSANDTFTFLALRSLAASALSFGPIEVNSLLPSRYLPVILSPWKRDFADLALFGFGQTCQNR